ncbi:hypothetical protein [Psychrobacter sp.]|uniref:hypothetical protein n=1 Tax=Psychrobacter sp. TaxID=56811 RepID=UPI00356AAE90
MQMRHLIIFAIVGIFGLLGFNIINSSQREKHREAITANSETELADSALSKNNDADASSAIASDTSGIASKPLGQQPKAILDNATAKIDQAQQADAARLKEMRSAQ